MKLADFGSYFRREQEDAEIRVVARAREILDWMSQAYHQQFMAWLEEQASRPFSLDKPDKIVQSAVRANTLREVQEHLRVLERESRRVQAEARE